MKRLSASGSILLLGISLLILTGCAEPKPTVAYGPVGPAFRSSPGSGPGKLIVYSAWDRFDTLDAEHRRHTPYTVSSSPTDSGASSLVKVRNQQGSFGEDPDVVTLPAGQYWVQARVTNVGRVQVPVIIQAGQTTIVYLDGSGPLPDAAKGTNQANAKSS
jgi:hypothetical protein